MRDRIIAFGCVSCDWADAKPYACIHARCTADWARRTLRVLQPLATVSARDKSKRESLFVRGSEAAERGLGVAPGTYVCPLCARPFQRNSLDSGELTLEHVPPSSVGGRGIVLVCRDCNSRAGHTIDAAIAGRETAFAFQASVAGMDTDAVSVTRVSIGGETLNATFERDEGWGGIKVLPDRNDPAALARLNDLFDRFERGEGADEMTIGVRVVRGFDGGRALVGDLKAAYLLAFAVLGYRWAADPSLSPVRAQIADPDREILGRWWLDPNHVAEHVIALTDTRTDPVIRCLCVRLPRTVVLLPWFDRGDLYARIAAATSSGAEALQFGTSLRFPWPASLDMRLDILDVQQLQALG